MEVVASACISAPVIAAAARNAMSAINDECAVYKPGARRSGRATVALSGQSLTEDTARPCGCRKHGDGGLGVGAIKFRLIPAIVSGVEMIRGNFLMTPSHA